MTGCASKDALQALIDHTRYMEGLQDKGKVIMAGGFLDGTGGMDIIETDTIEEALEISRNDPLAKHSLIRQDIKAWSTDLEGRTKFFTELHERLR